MTDASIDMASFVADEDELMFDEPVVPAAIDLPTAPPAAADTPETAAPAKKSRRAPRKGAEPEATPAAASAEFPGSAAPAGAAAEEPVDPSKLLPRHSDGSAGSTLSDHPKTDRRQPLLIAVVALALVGSFASLGGLVTVSRTLAAAQADRAQAAAQRAALAQVPAIVATLDRATARLAAATATLPTAPTPPKPAATPLTADELHRTIDDLKLTIAARQGDQDGASLASAMHGNFADMAARLQQIDRDVQALAAPPRPDRPAVGHR